MFTCCCSAYSSMTQAHSSIRETYSDLSCVFQGHPGIHETYQAHCIVTQAHPGIHETYSGDCSVFKDVCFRVEMRGSE